jgi:hypothetical protein
MPLTDKQEARVIKIIEGGNLEAVDSAIDAVLTNPLGKKELKAAKKELARVAKLIDKALAVVAPVKVE